MTQRRLILTHLRRWGFITPMDALELYGVMRLAARISDLRYDGYHIDTEMVHALNRYGDKVKYAKYILTTSE